MIVIYSRYNRHVRVGFSKYALLDDFFARAIASPDQTLPIHYRITRENFTIVFDLSVHSDRIKFRLLCSWLIERTVRRQVVIVWTLDYACSKLHATDFGKFCRSCTKNPNIKYFTRRSLIDFDSAYFLAWWTFNISVGPTNRISHS